MTRQISIPLFIIMQFLSLLLLAAAATTATAGLVARNPMDNIHLNTFSKRATLPVPKSKGTVTFKAPTVIKGVFDGGMKTYGRGVKCTGQDEGGDADAVFILENGATLKNAIIGKDQIEGVHCKGACTIENVWWPAVCEGT